MVQVQSITVKVLYCREIFFCRGYIGVVLVGKLWCAIKILPCGNSIPVLDLDMQFFCEMWCVDEIRSH